MHQKLHGCDCLNNSSSLIASIFALLHGVLFAAEEEGYWDVCYNRLLKVLWQITCFT